MNVRVVRVALIKYREERVDNAYICSVCLID